MLIRSPPTRSPLLPRARVRVQYQGSRSRRRNGHQRSGRSKEQGTGRLRLTGRDQRAGRTRDRRTHPGIWDERVTGGEWEPHTHMRSKPATPGRGHSGESLSSRQPGEPSQPGLFRAESISRPQTCMGGERGWRGEGPRRPAPSKVRIGCPQSGARVPCTRACNSVSCPRLPV